MKPKLSSTVRQLRTILGQTQQEFADLLGTTQRTVARWEADQAPRGTVLAKLARIASSAGFDECAAVFRRGFSKELEAPNLPEGIAQILGAGSDPNRRPGVLSMIIEPVPDNAEETEVLAAVLRVLRNPEKYRHSLKPLLEAIHQARDDNKKETLRVQSAIHLVQGGQAAEQVAVALNLPTEVVERISKNVEQVRKTIRSRGGAK